MNTLVLSFTAVLAGLTTQTPEFKSATQVITVDNPPIVGLWRLHLPRSTHCTEEYNFKSDKKMTVVSGDEWTYGSYDLVYSEKKLPVLVLHTTFDDNNIDCSGVQKDQSGERFAAYFKKNHDNEFELCATDAGKQCFMKFNRILPY